MSYSTEESVREVLIESIKLIAPVDMGCSTVDLKIHPYLLEYEARERWPNYLMQPLATGAKAVQAWGVMIVGADPFWSSQDKTLRTYDIRVAGYYARGVGGEGVNRLITHARKVRKAIRDLTTNLNRTVDRVIEGSQLNISLDTSFDEGEGALVIGTMDYVAEKAHPDF